MVERRLQREGLDDRPRASHHCTARRLQVCSTPWLNILHTPEICQVSGAPYKDGTSSLAHMSHVDRPDKLQGDYGGSWICQLSDHLAFSYSGPTAAHAYVHLDAGRFKRIFILGPSHHVHLEYVCTPDLVRTLLRYMIPSIAAR